MEALGAMIRGGHDPDALLDRYEPERLSVLAQCVAMAEDAFLERIFGPGKGGGRHASRRARLGGGDPTSQALAALARSGIGVALQPTSDEQREDLRRTADAFWRRGGENG